MTLELEVLKLRSTLRNMGVTNIYQTHKVPAITQVAAKPSAQVAATHSVRIVAIPPDQCADVRLGSMPQDQIIFIYPTQAVGAPPVQVVDAPPVQVVDAPPVQAEGVPPVQVVDAPPAQVTEGCKTQNVFTLHDAIVFLSNLTFDGLNRDSLLAAFVTTAVAPSIIMNKCKIASDEGLLSAKNKSVNDFAQKIYDSIPKDS